MSNADFEQRLAQRARRAAQRGSVVHRARHGVCGDEFTVCRMQTLFDEVSHQLYTECKRIEGVQETVNAYVKQSKELEAIHHKLKESHQMLTQMSVTQAW